jgi:branched-chain amino acid transport system substrate-binding protein
MPMKRIHYTFGLILTAAILAGCASAPVSETDVPGAADDPGGLLIQEAEQFYQGDQSEKALDGFSQYLRQYPKDRWADLALLRLGAIFTDMEIPDAAEAFFKRLLAEFPDSPHAEAAQLAIIDGLMSSNQTVAAASRAQQALDTATPEMRRQLRLRLLQMASADGKTPEAALYTYRLYADAENDEKTQWAERLDAAIELLEAEAVEAVWDRMTDPYARSLLMYRYAVLQVMLENYDTALEVLDAFRHTYPTHPYAGQAAQVVESLEQRLRFTPRTVGCLLPLSGPYKLYGQRVLNGIELALSLFDGAESSAPIRLVIEDSEADADASIRGVKRLVNAGAGAILGPIVSAPAAVEEAQRLHIPMIPFTQKSGIAASGDFIFRHFITPEGQVKALVSYFINAVGLHDFAVLYPGEAYGQTFMALFLDEVARQGGRMMAIERYDTQQTDFAETIRKLVGIYYTIPEELKQTSAVRLEDAPYFSTTTGKVRNIEDLLPDPMTRLTGLFFQDPDQDRIKGPAIGRKQEQESFNPIVDFDVLFIPDAPKTAGLILPQLAYHDIKDVYLAGTNLWHSPQLIQMSRKYAQSAVMADGFFKDGPSSVVRRFVSAYQDLFGTDPGIIEAFAFDTAWILFNAMARPGMQYRHVLRDSLLQTYEPVGVTGPTAFDGDGEAIKSLSLLRVKGDRFIEIQQ